MTPPLRSLGPLAAAVWLSGCLAVTVNVTFPEEKLEGAASSIEELVRGGRVPPVPKTPPPPARQGAAPKGAWWAVVVGPAVAEAQVPEIKTWTPEVLAIVESRRARYAALAAVLAGGCLGENNRGLVKTSRLYRTLVAQNNMPPADLARVQAAFAKTNRAAAPPGTWIQDDAGQWSLK